MGDLMAEPTENHKRFQAAVDVIQNLPKHGSFRPSYEVMLRFYSLYKQAMFGPCTSSCPGFWDPVGRYKWDAWKQLGDMSRDYAMTAYVDEMKKVAQEVIDRMPVNEKTASFYHYFEPLYHVIHDMPRPPENLLFLRPTLSDPPVLTSDSESEIFCDSVEQLDNIKLLSETHSETYWQHEHKPAIQVNQLGAGVGEKRVEDRYGFSLRRLEQSQEKMGQGWDEPPCDHSTQVGQQPSGVDGGDSDRGTERFQNHQVQQQIMLVLVRLRDDMRSIIKQLEVVENLAAANVQNSQWRTCTEFIFSQTKVENWWPTDVSGRILLLFLIWPFIAQGIVFILQQKDKNIS